MHGIQTVRSPNRQDTFDLRDQMLAEDHAQHAQAHADAAQYTSDEEHSVLEDDSDGEGADGDYIDDDDASSELSIPNESIDFDLVYALHSFAATVEGQANVVKGDSLFLMDDSNSYWWLVRVLKTQEVGYIPAENIETPFERLARLNKHRNVDLSSATQAELQGDVHQQRDRLRTNLSSRAGNGTPSPTPERGLQRSRNTKSVIFQASFHVHRYPPAVWGDEDEDEEDVEWDDEPYEDEDPDLVDEPADDVNMEPDDGMSWEEGAAAEMQAARMQAQATQGQRAQDQTSPQPLQQQVQREGSRERLGVGPDSTRALSPSSPPGPKSLDPAQATDTVKLSVTPPIVCDGVMAEQQKQPQQQAQGTPGPLLPSDIMRQQEEQRKRQREEIEALEAEARKRANKMKEKTASPSPESRPNGGAKLKKEREVEDDSKEKKKKGGMLSGLFGRRKDKGKDKGSSENGSVDLGRPSEESSRSSNAHLAANPSESGMTSPTTAAARQQQQQMSAVRNSTDPKRQNQQQQQQYQQGTTTPPTTPPQQSSLVSQHASQLRQRDQQQQALYQQYLNRSPSSPPDLQPSYGLQSASAIMPHASSFNSSSSSASGLGIGLTPESAGTRRPRPGSLVLSPTATDGQGVPELSVIRVFAGNNLQTEATFKTVLLNSSTTSQDLVRQAIQRFRLPAGEDENDYYLTIKQVEGSSAVLRPQEKPLGVFENLVEAAMELPKVKRSSVGSISSVSSNLSLHPAIKKLSMNDFTDDSAVKFYLNRRSIEGEEGSAEGQEGDDTLIAELDDSVSHTSKPQYLSVSTAGGPSVAPERFSSPSFRFTLQLVIYPEDLPDDMVFDSQTEAIVFKNSVRDRGQPSIPPGISMSQRRKVFALPKNITVAEVIEMGLDMFGIVEGVVDGGDEVEDKVSKRKSSSRVRYGLSVSVGGQERELSPTSKVIEAYPRPPTYRTVDRRFSESKRRSVDSGMLLGNPDEVSPDDPIFILRRAVTYRTSSSRHRNSAPLDEIALQNLHRVSASTSSVTSDNTSGVNEEARQRQPSKQDIIAAQRAAVRANQRAILSTQANSERGLDVLLPGNAMLRSSRYEVDDRIRYSYVDPQGESYDISDIVEQEWRRESNINNRNDLLEGVLGRNEEAVGDQLDRVLSRVKEGKGQNRQLTAGTGQDVMATTPTTSNSEYSFDQAISAAIPVSTSRTATPVVGTVRSPTPTSVAARAMSAASGSRTNTPTTFTTASEGHSRIRTTTPTAAYKQPPDMHQRQASSTSVLSDASGYRTAAATPTAGRSKSSLSQTRAQTPAKRRRPVVPNNDFGLSGMMAVIELRAQMAEPEVKPRPAVDPVDEMLFGKPLNADELHPQIRDVYGESFKKLEEMDQVLDELLRSTHPNIAAF
ncbi:hypothetical protein GLOTRDRAFT_136558 [Gloeophyllum trabeum ATCC 11539]|uniref:SH3 domain-containing protein n=1 Tax=Gloeophyllum trabeum (strain ATCC 11539 / FP-39264 / Madison 617) TaxID=670483 RepID=S7S1Y7_GLOTA|nr:uncharacterized protein GLOTRDRAFT_136558 [Gloeophyllum trabeum ATCC 11539]EPQ59784.1 hypothetical protein GLOTRDRAFT_136558 [Gloeophyllum trabeum ATCC 11539]